MDYLIPNIPTDRGGLRQDRRAGSEEDFPDPSEGEGLQTPHRELYWDLAQYRMAEGCPHSPISLLLPSRFSHI